MKKILIGLVLVFAVLGATAFVYRDQIGLMLTFQRLKPAHSFVQSALPPAPDYSNTENWAALPDRSDAADVLPGGDTQDLQADAPVDVFFVHPTTYYQTSGWNQPLDDVSTNELTDSFVMRSQASVFNSCCKVYAPRYRQATLFSFMDSSGSGAMALDLAYSDVERAFDYFLDHFSQGRPFVLAAHSQGSVHLRKLLEERISGTALRERLVAAYPIGFHMDGKQFAAAAPDIPVCNSPGQVGCVATWSAVGPRVTRLMDTRAGICVNPLTWRTDGERAGHDLNIGAVAWPAKLEGQIADLKGPPEGFSEVSPVLETGVADAQCVDGQLMISEVRSEHYSSRPLGRDNYHIYDYNLFHMNLRRNVEHRVAQYLGARAPEATTSANQPSMASRP